MEKKPRLLPKSKFLVKQKFMSKVEKPVIFKEIYFKKITDQNGNKKYINCNKNNKLNLNDINLTNKTGINKNDKSIKKRTNHNIIFKYLKSFVKNVNIPADFELNDVSDSSSVISKIKIRKTNKSLNIATNPYSESEEGESVKFCLNTIPLYEIHPQKFIMLENGVCYDIELLVSYIINRYQSQENYNLDPEFQKDPVWKNNADVNKILNHVLIKNPDKLPSNCYMYGKGTYCDNVDIFREIIHEHNINKPYFKLFDKYPQFLISINRLGAIFHIEQPTSYFNLDTIMFKEIKGLNDNNITVITDKLINIIKMEHMDKLTNIEFKNIDELVSNIHEIIVQYEYAYFSHLMENLNLVLTNNQLDQLIKNIAYMLAFQINFNEGSQAKIRFINYINDMDEENKNLALTLVNDILTSDDCIHRQGNRLRYIFIKWWYRYLNYHGIDNMEISKNYIPITYGSEINKKCIISSPLLEKYNETTHGYFPVKCPCKNNPALYYKMGNISKWDGINLNTYTFCCRLNDAPY